MPSGADQFQKPSVQWLMCETRNQQRQQSDNLGENNKREKRVRLRGSGPRDNVSSSGDGKNWSLTSKESDN